MNQSNPIYLDTSFVVDVFEDSTGVPAPVSITKTRDISAGASAGFFSAGASSSESREFPFGAKKMYKQILPDLKKYPSVDITHVIPADLPEYFWAEGILGATGSNLLIGGETFHRESYFRLYSDLEKYAAKYVLVINDTYFSSGYDQVSRHLAGSCQGFGIGIYGLFRLLAIDPVDAPICAPMIMEKTKNV